MALYQNQSDLAYSGSTVFTLIYNPGDYAPYGGIYKCAGCGLEIGTAKHHQLPPQNHHQHQNRFLAIRWQPTVIHA
jgi:hypothetical protein